MARGRLGGRSRKWTLRGEGKEGGKRAGFRLISRESKGTQWSNTRVIELGGDVGYLGCRHWDVPLHWSRACHGASQQQERLGKRDKIEGEGKEERESEGGGKVCLKELFTMPPVMLASWGSDEEPTEITHCFSKNKELVACPRRLPWIPLR